MQPVICTKPSHPEISKKSGPNLNHRLQASDIQRI